jgi:hypothetical protein
VAIQLFVLGLYRPPVLREFGNPIVPPQTIISLPVHTAVWDHRAAGAFVMLVGSQVSMPGLYTPPVLVGPPSPPPQTIISLKGLPVQIAVGRSRAGGAFVVLVDVQLFVLGLYLPPVFKPLFPSNPPQTIISLSAQTAACRDRPTGALVVLVAVQVSVPGLYLPPVFRSQPKEPQSFPPQTIISSPVQTAV